MNLTHHLPVMACRLLSVSATGALRRHAIFIWSIGLFRRLKKSIVRKAAVQRRPDEDSMVGDVSVLTNLPHGPWNDGESHVGAGEEWPEQQSGAREGGCRFASVGSAWVASRAAERKQRSGGTVCAALRTARHRLPPPQEIPGTGGAFFLKNKNYNTST